jgi:ADP-ribose pyrophosphatase
MGKQVEIINQEDLCNVGFLQVEVVRLRHELYKGGMTAELKRYNVERGDGVAIVLHDPVADSVVFVEQFRYATYRNHGGWIMELPAGILRAGEAPDEAMRREALEEVGYRLTNLQPISVFYPSPGILTERIFLFYSQITPQDRVQPGGGVPAEIEDIRIFNVTFAEVQAKMTAGEIVDAKTLIGLQWLQLKKLRNTDGSHDL